MKYSSALNIQVTLKPSRLANTLNWSLHACALGAISISHIPASPEYSHATLGFLIVLAKCALAAIVIFSGFVHQHRIKRQTAPWHLKSIHHDGDSWFTQTQTKAKTGIQTGKRIKIALQHARIGRLGIALVVKEGKKRKRYRIFKDQVSDEAYRKLCLLLNYMPRPLHSAS